MLSGITIGQYFPGNSLVHRMDPRVKLVLTFAYIIAVFIPRNWVGLAAAVAFLIQMCIRDSPYTVALDSGIRFDGRLYYALPLYRNAIAGTTGKAVAYSDGGMTGWEAALFRESLYLSLIHI